MKNISLIVVVVAVAALLGSVQAASIRPAVLGGAYDELLPEAVKGKTFVPSIKVRWEYDDNVYAGNESWKLYAEPKIDLHWISAVSYFGLSYQYSFIWYDDRPIDDTDMAHDFLLDVRHYFTPTIEVAVRDVFRFTQEPWVPEELLGLAPEVSYRTLGDYLLNRASVALNVQTGRQVWWNVSYSNQVVDYDEDDWSASFDRMSHTGGLKLQYLATPQTKVNVGGTFTDIGYDESPGNIKDSQSWIGYVGLDQNLTKKCIGSIIAGWENRDFDSLGDSEDAPYVDVSIASAMGKKGNVKAGYRHGLGETLWSDYAAREVNAFYGGLNAWLANWTSVHIHTSYEMADLERALFLGMPEKADEDVWLLGIVLRQHVHRDMYIEAGYRRTDVSSDISESDYERNRYYIGFGGIF